jgi:acetyl/propionyl-CoA carboxylase alpha subunit
LEEIARGISPLRSSQYRVSLGGAVHIVEPLGEGMIQVDDLVYSYNVVRSAHGEFSMLLNDVAFEIFILGFTQDTEDKFIQLGIKGVSYDVIVEDRRSLVRKEMLLARPHSSGVREIKAPMPGKVVRIEVKSGDDVGPGTGLLVLEAMKMENEIKSTVIGLVEKIHVGTGKAVEKGEVLVSIRPKN